MDAATIQPFLAKCKASVEAFLASWGLILVVFLVALASFGLGKLAALEEAKQPVSVVSAPQEGTPQGLAAGGLVVASKNGSVYHFPWCGGASQINEANKVWFSSEDAAKAAGYTPSKSCKGLSQ